MDYIASIYINLIIISTNAIHPHTLKRGGFLAKFCKQTKEYDRFSSSVEPEIGMSDYCLECLRKIVDGTTSKK